MKKTISIILVAIILVFAFTGCEQFNNDSESTRINSSSRNNENIGSYNYKFSYKNTQKIQTIYIKEKGNVLFKYNSFVNDGDVGFTLETEQGKIMFEDSGKRFSFNETFSLDEGLYRIIIDLKEARKGNIKLEIHSDKYFEYCNLNIKD